MKTVRTLRSETRMNLHHVYPLHSYKTAAERVANEEKKATDKKPKSVANGNAALDLDSVTALALSADLEARILNFNAPASPAAVSPLAATGKHDSSSNLPTGMTTEINEPVSPHSNIVAGSEMSVISHVHGASDSESAVSDAGSGAVGFAKSTNLPIIVDFKPENSDIQDVGMSEEVSLDPNDIGVLRGAQTLRFALTPDSPSILVEELDMIRNATSLSPTITERSAPGVFDSKSVMNVNFVPRNSRLQRLDPMEYAQYFWNKYVQTDSEFEINVPWRTKGAVKKCLDNHNAQKTKEDPLQYAKDMFVLFDKAWTDIHQMISVDSFTRFQQTKDFEIVLRIKQRALRAPRSRSVSTVMQKAIRLSKVALTVGNRSTSDVPTESLTAPIPSDLHKPVESDSRVPNVND